VVACPSSTRHPIFRSFVSRRRRAVSLPPILNDDGDYESLGDRSDSLGRGWSDRFIGHPRLPFDSVEQLGFHTLVIWQRIVLSGHLLGLFFQELWSGPGLVCNKNCGSAGGRTGTRLFQATFSIPLLKTYRGVHGVHSLKLELVFIRGRLAFSLAPLHSFAKRSRSLCSGCKVGYNKHAHWCGARSSVFLSFNSVG